MKTNYWDCFPYSYTQQQQCTSMLNTFGYCGCDGIFSKQSTASIFAPSSFGEQIISDERSISPASSTHILKLVPVVILKQEHKPKSTEQLSPITESNSNGEESDNEPIIVKITLDSEYDYAQEVLTKNDIEEISELSDSRENPLKDSKIRKIKNLYWRKDVVVKTIIRSMRRYFLNRFRNYLKILGLKNNYFWNPKLMIELVSKFGFIY